MSRNIVQIIEIRRFEKSDQKNTKKRDFQTSELRSRSKNISDQVSLFTMQINDLTLTDKPIFLMDIRENNGVFRLSHLEILFRLHFLVIQTIIVNY